MADPVSRLPVVEMARRGDAQRNPSTRVGVRVTGRAGYPPEKRLQRDLGRAKDEIRELRQVVAWYSRIIAVAGIDVASLIEHDLESQPGVSSADVGGSS